MRLTKIGLIFLLVYCCTTNRKNALIVSSLEPIYLVNMATKSFDLNDTINKDRTTKFFIIYNSTNCKDCFRQVDNSLKKNRLKNISTKIFIVTTVEKASPYSLEYKKALALKKITSANNVFFEVATQEGLFEYTYPEDGIFKTYDINITPSILRYKKGKLEYFPYESIFKNGGYDDSWISK